MLRKVILPLLTFLCGILISIGVFYWTPPLLSKNLSKLNDFARAQELLEQSQPKDALHIILNHVNEIENPSQGNGHDWFSLLIQANEKLLDSPQLVTLYEYRPEAFKENENASLMVADAYLMSGKGKEFTSLRQSWKGRENEKASWLILDADNLLLDGKHKEALNLLQTKLPAGKMDTARLIRLALLNVSDNPKKAWDCLSEAHYKDPKNTDIRIYRAKILETMEKNQLAIGEYLAAIKEAPQNPFLRNQLAEFYIRHQEYAKALNTWSSLLSSSAQDFILIKTLFWSKVAHPIKLDWKGLEESSEPYFRYLTQLKPNQFWDQKEFEEIPEASHYLSSDQTTFWLRLLSSLKEGNEKEAYDLLKHNPFQLISWNSPLEAALKQILNYQENGFISDEKILTETGIPQDKNKLPPFFQQLNLFIGNEQSQKMPEDLKTLLLSREAYSAAFLSAGWMEAALQLEVPRVVSENLPSWVSYGYAQALRLNRGNLEALEFSTLQKPTPMLTFLIGELLLAEGKTDEAREQLNKHAREDSEIGFRTALLLSHHYMEQGEFEKAKEVIDSQPRLNQNSRGQEILAKIALMEGNLELADEIYSTLEEKSIEASAYLAEKAIENKNWKKARRLTELLLKEDPQNSSHQENLKKISLEEKKLILRQQK